MEETLESIIAFCSDNNRAVPMPPEWNRLFQMLANTHQKPSGGWKPEAPLILAAWAQSSSSEKVSRFRQHLEWAHKEGQVGEIGHFLRSLDEQRWAHHDELET